MGARVTIGIPVYNGAATLRRAVESALDQTYSGCIIHISDNASTDETPAIAAEFAALHSNIVYTRHEESLGLMGNFRYPLENAYTEYFMWLPADDHIAPRYIERMIQRLDADPDIVSCVSRVRFERADGRSQLARGTYPLLDDAVSNLANFLADPNDNCRSYGLYRTSVLLAAFPSRYFHGYDWALSAGTLAYGKHAEVSEVLMTRDETPRENYLRAIPRDNGSLLARLFPLLPLSWYLVARQKIPLNPRVLAALLHTNIAKHVEYAELLHPTYFRVTKRLWSLWDRYVDWRLLRTAKAEPRMSFALDDIEQAQLPHL